MNKKLLYIVDIRFKQKNLSLSNYEIEDNSEILSLTPYSAYLLDSIGKEHKTFHDIISELEFNDIVLSEYKKIEEVFLDYKNYSFLFRDFAYVKTFEMYLKILFKFLDSKKFDEYKLIYITDAECAKKENISDNSKSYIYSYNQIDKIIKIDNKDVVFYKKNSFYNKVSTFLYRKNLIYKIYSRFINKSKNNIELAYDNINYKKLYENTENYDITTHLSIDTISKFSDIIEKVLKTENQMLFISEQYHNLLQEFKKSILTYSNVSTVKLHPFTFLHAIKNYIEILLYEKNNIPRIFMQHGSYLQEVIFLKYNEIYPADINLVFNDFTKALFEKRGAKMVSSVGSVDFNYPIIEKEKKYDFLYITYCGYGYTGVQIFSSINTTSVDGNNIYQKHKQMIELFGLNFRDKILCIKMQRGVVDNMLYVPLLEISKKYTNVKIEFFEPLHNLIEKSRYIISDYFSSEFINRELHYKRDIILFKGAPLPLPYDELEDLDKMFILVDTMDNLQSKIENIELITKNRKRYDDVIEYYSSKNCDTKKAVKEILKNIGNK